MILQRARFDADTIERYGMGAGVIPFAILPDNTKVCLLGRERFCPQWKGSCRWSGFEGSRKDDERMVDTAVREFFEESLCLLPHINTESLMKRQYWIRVVLRIPNEKQSERYHSTYLVEVPYEENLPQRFDQTRFHIEHIERLLQEWEYTRPVVLGDGIDIGPIQAVLDENNAPMRIIVQRRVPHATPVLSPWKLIAGGEGDHGDVHEATLEGDAAYGVRQWSSLRDKIEKTLRIHPSIEVIRDDLWNCIQRVSIHRDYIEKDLIRWWTESELRTVMQQRGVLGSHRFRPYFMPVLQTILTEFQKEKSSSSQSSVPPNSPVPPVPPAARRSSPPPSPPRIGKMSFAEVALRGLSGHQSEPGPPLVRTGPGERSECDP